jgi:hypothetical protein
MLKRAKVSCFEYCNKKVSKVKTNNADSDLRIDPTALTLKECFKRDREVHHL